MSHGVRWRAELALVVMTFFWGLTFPLIGSALETIPPHPFLAARFALATLCFVPLAWRARGALGATMKGGIFLGALSWISYETQVRGLVTVSPGRAAFLTASSVLIVPLIAPFFGAGRWLARDLVAAGFATGALALIVDPRGSIQAGDLWVLLCALSWACYIVVLHRMEPRGDAIAAITFWQLATITAIALVMWVISAGEAGLSLAFDARAWRAIAYTAIFATVLAFWIQAHFQSRTSAGRAALIYTLEPVFALGATWVLGGRMMSGRELIGAALLLAVIGGSEVAAYLSPGAPPSAPSPAPAPLADGGTEALTSA